MNPCDVTRRVLIVRVPRLVASLGATALFATTHELSWAQSAGGEAVKTALEFGGKGGNEFPMEYPQSIGFWGGRGLVVHQLVLNGNRHGATAGDPTPEITLQKDDYWTEFQVNFKDFIEYIRLKSKHGHEISTGDPGGQYWKAHETGVRLLRVGGRSGADLDQIKLEYIKNYQASKTVDQNATAVLDFTPGGEETTRYKDRKYETAQAYQRITESMQEFSINTSAEGEFYAKFSASTGFKTSESTKESVQSSVTESVRTAELTKRTIGQDEIAVQVCSVTIMKDSDGNPWMYPNAPPNWAVLKAERFKTLVGYYDLTSGVTTQTGLSSRMTNGYRVLVAN